MSEEVHDLCRHDLLIESSAGRLPQLIPMGYGRMTQSPFAFFRGAAAIMAADLAHTPNSGIRVQVCGDCLGTSSAFEDAVARFAMAYAEQNARDHQVLLKAIRAGRIDVLQE